MMAPEPLATVMPAWRFDRSFLNAARGGWLAWKWV